MKKWFTGLYTLLGLAALAALTVLLIVLFSRAKNPVQVGQVTSPVGMPTMTSIPSEAEVAFQSPIQSPAPTSTTPSEDWPTLTPPPTLQSPPTRTGTPSVKKVTQTPIATRPRLLLSPTPEGRPPHDLQSLYYVANVNEKPALYRIEMDAQGRRWSDSSVSDNLVIKGILIGLYPSPNNKYMAAEIASGGGGPGPVFIMELSSGRVWCPFADPANCLGSFGDWMSGDQALFRAFDSPPPGVVMDGVMAVDVNTGLYHPLHLPVSPDGKSSLVKNVSVSPDGYEMAYSIFYWENKTSFSEIWVTSTSAEEKRLILKMEGVIASLSWSPTGDHLIFLFQRSRASASADPSELWLINTDGSDARLLTDKIRMPGEPWYRPVWSPDGFNVAFVQVDNFSLFLNNWRGPGTNVSIVNILTGQVTRLSTFEDRSTCFPTWSPDGRFVAFVSNVIEGEEILSSEVWIASADGGRSYIVSGTAAPYNALAWLPFLSDGESR